MENVTPKASLFNFQEFQFMNESLDSFAEYYPTEDSKLPNLLVVSVPLENNTYMFTFKRMNVKGLYELEGGWFTGKVIKYWKFKSATEFKQILSTLPKIIESSIPFLTGLTGISIKFRNKTEKNVIPFINRVLYKSHLKKFFTVLNVDNTQFEKSEYAMIVKKGKDPKKIFSSSVFKDFMKDYTGEANDLVKEMPAIVLDLPSSKSPEKKQFSGKKSGKITFGNYEFDAEDQVFWETEAEKLFNKGKVVDLTKKSDPQLEKEKVENGLPFNLETNPYGGYTGPYSLKLSNKSYMMDSNVLNSYAIHGILEKMYLEGLNIPQAIAYLSANMDKDFRHPNVLKAPKKWQKKINTRAHAVKNLVSTSQVTLNSVLNTLYKNLFMDSEQTQLSEFGYVLFNMTKSGTIKGTAKKLKDKGSTSPKSAWDKLGNWKFAPELGSYKKICWMFYKRFKIMYENNQAPDMTYFKQDEIWSKLKQTLHPKLEFSKYKSIFVSIWDPFFNPKKADKDDAFETFKNAFEVFKKDSAFRQALIDYEMAGKKVPKFKPSSSGLDYKYEHQKLDVADDIIASFNIPETTKTSLAALNFESYNSFYMSLENFGDANKSAEIKKQEGNASVLKDHFMNSVKGGHAIYAAAKYYTGSGYQYINEAFRKLIEDGELTSYAGEPENLDIIKAFDNAIPSDKDLTVIRNFEMSSKIKEMLKDWKVGKDIIDPGCLSTSLRNVFYYDHGVTIVILVPKGASIIPMLHHSQHKGENEIILPAGSILKPFEIVRVPGHKNHLLIKAIYTGNVSSSLGKMLSDKLKGVKESVKKTFKQFMTENKNKKKDNDKNSETGDKGKWSGDGFINTKKMKDLIKKGVLKVKK